MEVKNWVDGFQRVARHNRWDNETGNTNVICSLSGMARTWFLNPEGELGDWDTFGARFRDLFGGPASRTAHETHGQSFRTQKTGEVYISYI